MENAVPVLTTWNLASALARTTFPPKQGEIEHFAMNRWIQSTCLFALEKRQRLCFPLLPRPGEYDTTEGKFRVLRTDFCWVLSVIGGWDVDTDPAFTDTGSSSCCGQLSPSLFTHPEGFRGN